MLSLASRFSLLPDPQPILLTTPHGASSYEALLLGEIRIGEHVTRCLVRTGNTEFYVAPAWVSARRAPLPANVIAFPGSTASASRRRPAVEIAP